MVKFTSGPCFRA